MREMLSAAQLEEILREAAVEFDLDLSDASPDANLRELGMDSLDQYELITFLEDKTGYRFTDDKMGNIKTINDVIQSILELQREATSGEEAVRHGAAVG